MYCDDDDIYSILIYDAHHAYTVDDEHSMHLMMMYNECWRCMKYTYSGSSFGHEYTVLKATTVRGYKTSLTTESQRSLT